MSTTPIMLQAVVIWINKIHPDSLISAAQPDRDLAALGKLSRAPWDLVLWYLG